MSTFLTPPVWYDKDGNLIEMLSGAAKPGGDGGFLTNLAIGQFSMAGTFGIDSLGGGTVVGFSAGADDYSTALGCGASARSGIAIGYRANVSGNGIGIGGDAIGGGIAIGGNTSNGGIAIGHNATAGASGCIVIGDDANASTSNTIQLGNNNTNYTLNVGSGDGVTSGYIEKGISSRPGNNYGFVDVSYSQDGNYVKELVTGGIYIVRVKNNTIGHNTLCTFLFEIDGRKTEYSSMFEYDGGEDLKYAVIKATPDPDPNGAGLVTLSVVDSVEYGTGPILEHKNFTISVRCISQEYSVG